MDNKGYVILVDGVQIHCANSPLAINVTAQSINVWGMDNPNVSAHFTNAVALSEAVRLQTALDIRFGEGKHLVQTACVEMVSHKG
ncbi:hypothetical protein [Shewanella xiamenensis]|uniref:hypothetical protein n=1 Tax=Shewanella xiamenensis TaxID=332186 RepID=UPI001CC5944E|nr:hypothetical protein [Shewanella xiamenensis]BDA63024.1 hypothetical protein NUITMVS1_44870 [Shewanella xiamenensis]